MNRFAEAMGKAEHEEGLTKDFMESVIGLAKELAEKGAAGAELSDKEKKFLGASAAFMLNGILASIGK